MAVSNNFPNFVPQKPAFMTKYRLYLLTGIAVFSAIQAFSQEVVRSSSSMYLPAWNKSDVTVAYDITAEGKRFQPTWGLDQAWISEQNMRKGINHMLKENVGIGRSAFRFSKALVNDSALATDAINNLRKRNTNLNLASTTLPIVFTADQEAGADEYFVKNKVANNEHWAAMINSHVHWMQQNTKHPIVGISPFNEGDYWSVEEGASPTKQYQVAKLLKENYPRCADIAMVGGNTLNDDKALEWYTSGKKYYDWGNTHQLAGSFDNFAKFFQQLAKDGKVGYADEMHNTVEAMVGLEYGMTVGIWWGFDSRARGEFCQISRNGVRLGYGEHRDNWTAASVYRHDDGRVKAFIGSSERQAVTTNYQFVSTSRDVYYDGYGPVREYFSTINGGTGYQKGQTNAERVIDVTWGEDVAPCVIGGGVYKIYNKKTGGAVVYSSNGGNILLQKEAAANKRQQWNVNPVTKRSGGDLSFLDIEAAENEKIRMNVLNYSTATADVIAYTQEKPSSNEQWYIEYVGDGYYYIRNRESALYLSASSNSNGKVIQTTMLPETTRDRMLWRFLPLGVTYETTAPTQPSGLQAEAHSAAVTLSWNAVADEDLQGYMVLRAPKGTEDWNTIARILTTTSYTDNTCHPGTTYIYKVKAIDQAQNLSEASATVEATPSGQRSMIARWQLDENLYDATPNMMDMVFKGTPNYQDDAKEGSKSLLLNGSSNYLQLPYEVACSDELTIAMWVKMRGSNSWQRLFDFGNDTDHYMFLTPSTGSAMRFSIKNGDKEQQVSCKKKLPVSQWKHVAVTIAEGKTVIYIDGEEAASSTDITIKPSDIHPVLNYIGRSQFNSDPFLSAYLDDIRVYNHAVSDADLKVIMDGGEPTAIQSPEADDVVPTATYGIDGIKRDAPRRGLNIINGKKMIK